MVVGKKSLILLALFGLAQVAVGSIEKESFDSGDSGDTVNDEDSNNTPCTLQCDAPFTLD